MECFNSDNSSVFLVQKCKLNPYKKKSNLCVQTFWVRSAEVNKLCDPHTMAGRRHWDLCFSNPCRISSHFPEPREIQHVEERKNLFVCISVHHVKKTCVT